MNNVLEIKNLSKNYLTKDKIINAVDNITFNIQNNHFIAIVGPSGCGKSTILSMIGKLEDKSSGDIIIDKNTKISYMFQEDTLFPWLNVLENCLIGLKIKKELNEDNINYVKHLLKKYNLESFINSYPNELSGGMRQRVALIRTLATNPDILLLDEPFSALDYQTRIKVSDDVYKIIKEENKTAIMVTHDIQEAISMADKVILLSKRPAKIKNIYDIRFDNENTPSNKRQDEKFNNYYNLIWKDFNDEYKLYLRKLKITKISVIFIQIFILFLFLILWQILSDKNIINSFLCSSPKNIINTIINLYKSNDLLINIWVTLKEILISFLLGSLIGLFIAALLWYFPILSKIFDPYLTILNSLPKISLGPIIIIWAGANGLSIIIMALLISVISTIITIYTGFISTNKTRIKLLKSFGAKKHQIFTKVVIPSNINTIISSLKINLSMTFVGVIMGELLVSKQGLGYLINYGSQVFNTNLVMAGIILLAFLTSILYFIILYIEKKLIQNKR